MSCLSVNLSREGAISVGAALIPSDLTVGLERVGAIAPSFRKEEGISATARKVGGITARLSLVCETIIKTPYLEIEPTILWVYPDFANTNNVFSNTFWRII